MLRIHSKLDRNQSKLTVCNVMWLVRNYNITQKACSLHPRKECSKTKNSSFLYVHAFLLYSLPPITKIKQCCSRLVANKSLLDTFQDFLIAEHIK